MHILEMKIELGDVEKRERVYYNLQSRIIQQEISFVNFPSLITRRCSKFMSHLFHILLEAWLLPQRIPYSWIGEYEAE
jgi:hypothetical protein